LSEFIVARKLLKLKSRLVEVGEIQARSSLMVKKPRLLECKSVMLNWFHREGQALEKYAIAIKKRILG
jgi:hypothetical protein